MTLDLPKSLSDLPISSPKWVGKSVNRIEDPMLVTGRVEFIDNITLPGMLHCAILRSPYAHAKIAGIDTSEAEKLPGVFAIVTGEDAERWSRVGYTSPEGWGTHCMATDKARFAGEPVAAVAAVSRYVAEDALELINVDYEPLPVAVDAHQALEPDAPRIFEEHDSNVMYQRDFKWGDVDEAFANADHVFTESFRWHRVGANPIETFGVISQWDLIDETLTCRGSFQTPAYMALGRAAMHRLPSNKVKMIGQPHGGSFGGKGGGRGIDITALLSRKAGGRPVKWIEDRLEYLSAGGSQAWDRFYEASLAVRNDGTVTGLKVKLLDDLGATGEGFGATGAVKPMASFTGCYAIPAAEYDLTIVATNKLPASPYRGMGPPPHNFVLEQMMDIAARGLGIDPAEIRRRNFIPSDQFPYVIASGNEYDSGDYDATLTAVLEMAGYDNLRAEQEEARKQGRLRGIGIVSTIEPGVFDWNAYAVIGQKGVGVPEGVTVSIGSTGKIVARVVFPLEGQGQYTIVAQLLADYFAVELEDVNVIAQDSLADVGDTLIHPTEKSVQAVSFTYERKQWQALDETVKADFDYLGTVADGEIEIVSRSLDDKIWIVMYVMDNGPVRYYLYNRESNDARFLFTNRRALEGLSLAKMHPVVISSRDGLNLVSYYSLPVGSDSNGDGKPDEPLPTVLYVHGGPWARDHWGYEPIHQMLANRGYAVLSVNFRGSTGFGKGFINASNMEWSRKMHDDLLDAVQWAVDQGIADADRVAILGGSYGGYATLVGLTFTPDTFACGVDIVGPSSLVTLLESVPPYWQPMIDLFATRVGDHRTEEGRAELLKMSPLTYVDKIKKPLLIGQGANDPRVKQAESDQIVKTMQENETPVVYALYPDEGHGFARPENNLSFFALAEAFLARHIGGRYEPIGGDLDGSSLEIKTGRHEIPGLE